jgi:acyl-CoA thioester hydrolase
MPDLQEEKLKFTFKMKVELRWSDMDQLGHVNNAVYLTYFEQARIEYLHEVCKWNWKETGAILANAYVDYHRPVIYPAPTYVYVRVSKMGNKSFEICYMITSVIDDQEVLMTTGYTAMVTYDYINNTSIPIPTELRERIQRFENYLF